MKGDVTLTRSYSDGSAGKLSSGKGSVGPPHTLERLLSEFAEHRKLANRTHPTSLVSASDRIIDSLKRAFNKYYEDGEHPDQIWIVFIRIPYGRIQTTKVHSARKLAEECQHPEPSKFTHEYLFEWAIPQEYVVHSVSVETLIHRGLKMDQFRCISYEPAWHRCDKSRLPPLSLLRKAMADEYIRHCYDRWEVGVALGLFAKCFGARAPVDWIANQLFEDLAFGFFPRVQDGIHVALIEWWLLDEDFILGLDAHDEWRELQLDLMIDRWIDFYEDWCGQRHGTVGYKIAKAKLEHMEERLHADIEKEAIEIGL